ncbi:glycosyltransferase [Idiomarina sp. HP20-50]|uniref:glycosyltransferase n=1 Tax=Idiomarina sp. HP20-50 TaxID=3070813 RepID=UPI00294B5850|nr:glycosyltransferase [Idiomarina sp. HP20-50]MDV6316111.1 glycosyltransferase [Idiomarina sp. HP20-50]
MRIALLAAASSIHTARWANGLSDQGHEVHVISQHPVKELFANSVAMHLLPVRGTLGYFTMSSSVRNLLEKIRPDIVNAHYASGYGTTARLVNYSPWVLSVWGSDVYDFPHKSFLHKWLVRKNLLAADQVASTSRCMAEQTRKLAPELTNIEITPFGVSLEAFEDIQPISNDAKNRLVIGTIKSMKDVYGIDILIEAYANLVKRFQSRTDLSFLQLELRLVGEGEKMSELKALGESLGVSDSVHFIGRVPHSQVPFELEKLDIFAALSRSESFGVAILEAGAAGRPVVVSNVGGLPEVTIDGITGSVVPSEDPKAAADALEKMVLDGKLRQQMGLEAQKHVKENYSWEACVHNMLTVYDKTINEFRKGQ